MQKRHGIRKTASVTLLTNIAVRLQLSPTQVTALNRVLEPYVGERVYFAALPQQQARRISTALALLSQGYDVKDATGLLSLRLSISRKVARKMIMDAQGIRSSKLVQPKAASEQILQISLFTSFDCDESQQALGGVKC